MSNQLIHSLHTAFSRTKKNDILYIVPAINGYSISTSSFSTNGIRLYYSINKQGVISKFDDGMIFNIGNIDNLDSSNYYIK